MIADRAAHGLLEILCPGISAKVDPRGRFLVDKDAQFVTRFDESVVVWIVGQPHDVEACLLELQCILAVQGLRHRVADKGIVLVTIHADELKRFAVQQESHIVAQFESADAEGVLDAVHGDVAVKHQTS